MVEGMVNTVVFYDGDIRNICSAGRCFLSMELHHLTEFNPIGLWQKITRFFTWPCHILHNYDAELCEIVLESSEFCAQDSVFGLTPHGKTMCSPIYWVETWNCNILLIHKGQWHVPVVEKWIFGNQFWGFGYQIEPGYCYGIPSSQKTQVSQ